MEARKFWHVGLTADYSLSRVTENLIKFTGNLYNDLNSCCRALDVLPHPAFKPAEIIGRAFKVTGLQFDNISFRILCLVLSHCPSIVGVKFSNCGLSSEQLDMLADLCTKDHFQYLQVDWNGVASDPSKFVQFLRPESKLHTLVLRRSEINDAVFEAICQELTSNTVLLALDLYGNNLTSLEPFASAMRVNRTFKALSVAKCGLTDNEIFCLLEVIGRFPFPAEGVESYRKLEKDRDAIIAKNAKIKGKKQPDPVPIVDPIEQVAETQEWFQLKSSNFEMLNLSLNSFTVFASLQNLLSQANLNFKVLLMGPDDIAHADRKRLKAYYPDHFVAG